MNEVNPIRDVKHIEAMKKYLKGQNIRDYLMFMVGISSALRITDILNLKISDVWDGKKCKDFIILTEKKTKKTKRFAVSKNLSSSIKEYLSSYEYNLDDYLIKSKKGENKPITRQHAHLILSECAKSVGINEAISTHSMRKTFLYHAYKSGVDISLLQDLANHSSPKVTLRYIGITQEQKDQVYINLNL